MSNGRRILVLIISVVTAMAATGASGADDRAEDVSPLLAKYCNACHSGAKPKVGLDLTRLSHPGADDRGSEVWERIVVQLEARSMPPEGRPQPTAADAERIGRWASAGLARALARIRPSPGRVTIRRLNRAEYNNTIRDLTGVAFRPADDFPADDVGYGFDNIGDVLSMPPILMEKYFAAAEAVAERAIVAAPRASAPLKKRIEVESLDSTAGGDSYQGIGRILLREGRITAQETFPADGEYIVRVRAFGQHAGPEPPRMAFELDGQSFHEAAVTAGQRRPGVYSARVQTRAGTRRLSLAFLNDFYDPNNSNPANRDRNLVIDSIEIAGPAGFRPKPLPESHRRIIIATPRPAMDERDAARRVIEQFATRAFRRPARNEEVDRYLALVEDAASNGENFERRIQLVVTAILLSPHFLFRVELDPPGFVAGQVRPLDDFELASRLSYFLWSSMPDPELFRLARQGKLHDEAELEAQARRMLKDPKSRALVDNFAAQWLQLRALRTAARDPARFPRFDLPLRGAMRRESELFFEAVMREDRSVRDFLDADFTFVNERLADHYGLPGVSGGEFRRVQLGDDRRGGLITQASVLTVTSNPTRTSPVKRGKWVLEQILGAPPPPPLPNVPELSEGAQGPQRSTLRQRLEAHRANPSCANCHAKMDPIGFGLENFDATGAWRMRDGSMSIDASGRLPSGQTFRGPEGLKAFLLSHKDEFARCLTQKMLTYALGRGLGPADREAVDRAVAALSSDGYKFSRLVVEVVKSDPFCKRAGDARERDP
jgi:Protein of unknown function (DUF1592)/Protein of unknown function (DUF1588)/Protein of unknown function (DUF1587)/Protein of unknown function (DUF1585)/Protein of unknown function (DUF1595)/Ca-dependent carbohydrate-binding module xylan-binding/Planctomycete cytochrome C